jgi:hypothetical protein
MRSFAILFALFGCVFCHAQDTIRKRAVEEFQLKVFVGAGAAFNNGFGINSSLRENGFVSMQPVHANITTGLHFFNQHIDIDLGYDLLVNGCSNDETKLRTISNGFKLRAHYEVFVFKKFNIGAGFNIGYSNTKLLLFRKGHQVDFNDGTGIEGNQLTLFLERGVLGPSVSVRVKDHGRESESVKITASYELGITDKSWESNYFELENDIRESRLRQFVLNVIFDL